MADRPFRELRAKVYCVDDDDPSAVDLVGHLRKTANAVELLNAFHVASDLPERISGVHTSWDGESGWTSVLVLE